MSRASESELALLHAAVATILRTKIEGEEATASDITNAIKFLKDNSITCAPNEDNELGALQKQLQEKKETIRPDQTDLTAALEQLDFTQAQVN